MLTLQCTFSKSVTGLVFSQKGKTLVAGGSGAFAVWDLRQRTHVSHEISVAKESWVWMCDPAGQWLMFSSARTGLRRCALTDGRELPIPGSSDERHVTSASQTLDGTCCVMSRGGAGTNRLECWNITRAGDFRPRWSLRDGVPCDPDEPFLLNESQWSTNGVAISADGKRIACAESRGRGSSGDRPLIVLRHGTDGKLLAELGTSETGFTSRLMIFPSNKRLVVWDGERLELWDMLARKCTHHVPSPGRGRFAQVATHPDRDELFTVSTDGALRHWSGSDLSLLGTTPCSIGKLYAVAVTPDGQRIAVGGEKGRIACIDR